MQLQFRQDHAGIDSSLCLHDQKETTINDDSKDRSGRAPRRPPPSWNGAWTVESARGRPARARRCPSRWSGRRRGRRTRGGGHGVRSRWKRTPGTTKGVGARWYLTTPPTSWCLAVGELQPELPGDGRIPGPRGRNSGIREGIRAGFRRRRAWRPLR
jgi:hypothetical protein